ncbi:MAG: phosphoribosylformylglycinamidine synthase subunit PurQ, partial [Thermoplasmata archaeon]|nr:phosphoribosylformylglycinamidine synthase subunit PurQ [Thermoplasmata archaeon]
MLREDVKVCVLRIEGTNCEQETHDCIRRLGADPEIVHLKQLIGTGINEERRRDILDYQMLIIPGGFSAGDYIRAGAIFAARLKSALEKQLRMFVEQGYPVLGICNGFQVLIESGLLPAMEESISAVPQAVLNINDSNRFECRPTYLINENSKKCIFTSMLQKGKVVMFPSAHAEGKLMFPADKQEKMLKRLSDEDQIVFRYVDLTGNYSDYPWCPNGSISGIAGICNSMGNVMGLMPHPERAFFKYLSPDW